MLYGSVMPSVQRGAHLQYGCGCAVWMRHTISMDAGVQYGSVILPLRTKVLEYNTTRTVPGVVGGCIY